MITQGYPLWIRCDFESSYEDYLVVGWVQFGDRYRPVVIPVDEPTEDAYLLKDGTLDTGPAFKIKAAGD